MTSGKLQANIWAEWCKEVSSSKRVIYEKDIRAVALFSGFEDIVMFLDSFLRSAATMEKVLVFYRDNARGFTKNGLRPATINRRLSTLRQLVRWAHRSELIDRIPAVPNLKVDTPAVPVGPTAEQISKLLALAERTGDRKGRRAHAMFRMMATIGLSRKMLHDLNISDLRLDAMKVRIGTRNGEMWRDLDPKTCEALQNWLDVHPSCPFDEKTPLFVNLHSPISAANLTLRVRTSATIAFRRR
jgi:site-specific recombinase XerC